MLILLFNVVLRFCVWVINCLLFCKLCNFKIFVYWLLFLKSFCLLVLIVIFLFWIEFIFLFMLIFLMCFCLLNCSLLCDLVFFGRKNVNFVFFGLIFLVLKIFLYWGLFVEIIGSCVDFCLLFLVLVECIFIFWDIFLLMGIGSLGSWRLLFKLLIFWSEVIVFSDCVW